MRPIQILQRGRHIGEDREAFFGDLSEAAEYDDLLLRPAGGHGEDFRLDRSYHRRMTGEHAEIALDAGHVDLVDFAGEGELLGRDEIEVEGGHVKPANGGKRIASGRRKSRAIA